MKKTLGVQDALILRSMMLEIGGGYAELVLAKKTADTIFSEQELKDYQVTTTSEGIVWKTATKEGKPLPVTKEIELGPEVAKMIAAAFRKLDEARVLKQFHRGLYEQFVLAPIAD